MGLWEQILDWVQQWFGKKTPQSYALKAVEIPVWAEEKTREETRALASMALNRFSEIRFLIKELTEELETLEKTPLEEAAHERLQKVVVSSQQTMVVRMRNLLEKLNPPTVAEWKNIHGYARSSFLLLQKETESFGKNIAYTSILRKDEIKSLGEHWTELESALKELFEAFSTSAAVEKTTVIQQTYEQVLRLQQESKAAFSEHKQLENELNEIENKIKQDQESLAAWTQSSEAKAVGELQEQLHALEKQKTVIREPVSEVLGSIDKPLKRFQQLASSGQWALEKELHAFLSVLAEKPFKALEMDPKAQRLKEVLQEMKKAIGEGKIGFKDEKEKAKRLEALENAQRFDFFSNFFWKENELEKKRRGLEKELQSRGFFEKAQSAQKQMQELLQEKKQLEQLLVQANVRQSKNQLAFLEKKEILEKQLSKIAEKPVTVLWDE